MKKEYYAGESVGIGYESLIRIVSDDTGMTAYYLDKKTGKWVERAECMRAKWEFADFDEITEEKARELAAKWGIKI